MTRINHRKAIPAFAVLIALIALALPGLARAEEPAAANPFPSDWFWGGPEQRERHDALIGKELPEFDLVDWMNGEVTPEDMKGKIVVIDFWATWCGPCIAGIPKMNALQEKYKDQGVVIVGICGSGSGQERMAAIAEQHGIEFPIAKDHTQKAAGDMRVMWWPTYAIADREGKIRGVGFTPDGLELALARVVEEQPLPEPDVEAEAEGVAANVAFDEEQLLGWLEGDDERKAMLRGWVGKPAPAIQLTGWMNSEPMTLKDLEGKIVVLDFWATWCGPCLASVPRNNGIYEEYKEQGVVFIGVCAPRGGERMAEVAAEHSIKFPVALDEGGEAARAYAVNGFPDYYIIGRDGTHLVPDIRNAAVAEALDVILAAEGDTGSTLAVGE